MERLDKYKNIVCPKYFGPNFVFLGTALGCFNQCFFLIFRRQPTMVADIFFRPPPYHKNLPTALNSNLYNLCNYTDNNIL